MKQETWKNWLKDDEEDNDIGAPLSEATVFAMLVIVAVEAMMVVGAVFLFLRMV